MGESIQSWQDVGGPTHRDIVPVAPILFPVAVVLVTILQCIVEHIVEVDGVRVQKMFDLTGRVALVTGG